MSAWISRSVTCHTSDFRNLLLHVCCINIIPTPASVPPKGWRPTCTALWASAGQSSWYPYFGDRHLNKYHFTDHGAGNLAPIWYVGMYPTADHLQPRYRHLSMAPNHSSIFTKWTKWWLLACSTSRPTIIPWLGRAGLCAQNKQLSLHLLIEIWLLSTSLSTIEEADRAGQS